MRITQPDVASISQAVISIRQSKLPDPAEIGNSGSFFKNPVVSAEKAEEIKSRYPNLVSYPFGNGQMKLAAGWLIDQCGWKGFRRGDVGVHEKQALVLVNYGKGTGGEVWQLAQEIQASVQKAFGVMLEPEVNLYP